jgi:ferric-dicitrate binding protein FerR (iron transport regulator)
MLQDAHFTDLIAKHLSGNILPEEEQELLYWIEANPEHQRLFDELEKAWALSASYQSPLEATDADKGWQRLQARLHVSPQGGEAPSEPASRKIRPLRRWWAIAATLALLVLAALPLILPSKKETGHTNWALLQGRGEPRQAFRLNDGSTVWLHGNSKIWTHPDFPKVRHLRLEGEAFFEVAHQKESPFRIACKGAYITVLGTSFNVRGTADEGDVEVSVQSGVVQLAVAEGSTTDAPPLKVGAGKAAIFHPGEKRLELLDKAAENALAWQREALHFEGTPLAQVLPDLEHYFGVEMELGQPGLGQCTFQGDFEKPQLDEVLSVLQIALDLEVRERDGTYVFYGKPCQ